METGEPLPFSGFSPYGQEKIPTIPVQINAPSELDVCTWTTDINEKRRAFVINQMATGSDYEGRILVQNMHAVCEWLRTGQLPAATNLKLQKV